MSVRYLLDTNICIYIARHNPPAVREHFARYSAAELAMSVVTLGELRFGAEKSPAREKVLAVIQQLEALIEVAPLEAEGQPIGSNDLWLAAHARSAGWILVTNNEREFERVAGLQIENWVAG